MIKNTPKNLFRCNFFLGFYQKFYFFYRFTKISRNKIKEVKEEAALDFMGGNYDQETEFFESNLDIQRKAYIVVRATRDEAGSIMRINLLFSSLFGYSKEEIINKKINILMPELYAMNHNDFLNRFIENTNADQYYESKYLNINQNFFGKNKSGYIFPMTSKVIFLKEQLLFIATFVPQLIIKTNMQLIVNKEGVILDISASVIHFLKLDLAHLRKTKVYINEYIPNFLQEKEKYTTNPTVISLKIHLDNQENLCRFNCQVGNIDFFIIEADFLGEEGGNNEEAKIQKNFGFWIKLEKLDNNNVAVVSPLQLVPSLDKAIRRSSRLFKKDFKLNLGYKSGPASPERKNKILYYVLNFFMGFLNLI